MEDFKPLNDLLPKLNPSRPSPFWVPDASGCWCEDSEGTKHGKRWRAGGEPENTAYRYRETGEEVREPPGPRIWQNEVYCPCPVGESMWTAAREEWRKQDQLDYEAYILSHWQASGIPSRYRSFRFETSPLKEIAKRLDWTEYDDDHEPKEDYRRSWLLWGGYGTGKTGLAVAYARTVVEVGKSIIFRSMPDLLSELRSTYNRRRDDEVSEMDLLDQYRTASLLVLDDLGAEQVKDTGWLEDRLYQIIGHRHAEELQTIFTSNLAPQQLAERIGERNMWRIVEMCGQEGIIHVEGPNLRLTA